MLRQLHKLAGIYLGIHAHNGVEDDSADVYDYDWLQSPEMAGVGALTRLQLVGAVSLPPDWRQLSSLQHLEVFNMRAAGQLEPGAESYQAWGGFEWGDAPLTALTALTCLEIGELLPGGWGY